MSVVSNLKRMKRCTAELTDAKLRTVYTCTIHSSHLYSSHMYLFNAAVPVEDETEQSRWTQHRGHTQFDWMAYPFGVRCLFWHWKQFCFLPGYLETACETGSDAVIPSIDRLGRYPLSHRSARRQGTQNIQPKTDVLHDFWLPLLFLSFLENNVGIDHGWLAEPPAKVSPPLHRGTTYMVVGMVLIHQITPPPPSQLQAMMGWGMVTSFVPGPLGPSGWQSLF